MSEESGWIKIITAAAIVMLIAGILGAFVAAFQIWRSLESFGLALVVLVVMLPTTAIIPAFIMVFVDMATDVAAIKISLTRGNPAGANPGYISSGAASENKTQSGDQCNDCKRKFKSIYKKCPSCGSENMS
ncbi:MAG: hypothetical protein FWB71_02995 [Defluviitaleaceae bacterium]|nr:hypothetical protein [Defluviitaleaceae bacterium]